MLLRGTDRDEPWPARGDERAGIAHARGLDQISSFGEHERLAVETIDKRDAALQLLDVVVRLRHE